MLQLVQKSKQQIKDLESYVFNNQETEDTQILDTIKEKYNEIEIDFEDKEDNLNTMMWIIEINIMNTKKDYKIEVDDFRGLD